MPFTFTSVILPSFRRMLARRPSEGEEGGGGGRAGRKSERRPEDGEEGEVCILRRQPREEERNQRHERQRHRRVPLHLVRMRKALQFRAGEGVRGRRGEAEQG